MPEEAKKPIETSGSESLAADGSMLKPDICWQHSDRKATHLRESWFIEGKPLPCCDECAKKASFFGLDAWPLAEA